VGEGRGGRRFKESHGQGKGDRTGVAAGYEWTEDERGIARTRRGEYTETDGRRDVELTQTRAGRGAGYIGIRKSRIAARWEKQKRRPALGDAILRGAAFSDRSCARSTPESSSISSLLGSKAV
jgi:hypothetical protein